MPPSDLLQNHFLQAFLLYVFPVMLTGLSLAGVALLGYRAKFFQSAAHQGKIWNALRVLDDAAEKAVTGIFATESVLYKQLIAKGSLSSADLVTLKTAAVVSVKAQLAGTGSQTLNGVLDAFGVKIDPAVEAQVLAVVARITSSGSLTKPETPPVSAAVVITPAIPEPTKLAQK